MSPFVGPCPDDALDGFTVFVDVDGRLREVLTEMVSGWPARERDQVLAGEMELWIDDFDPEGRARIYLADDNRSMDVGWLHWSTLLTRK